MTARERVDAAIDATLDEGGSISLKAGNGMGLQAHLTDAIHEAEEAMKKRCAAVALAREPSTYKRVWVIGDDPDAIRENIAAAILALGEDKP